MFTTREGIDTSEALRVRTDNAFKPFSREKLLISVYESLRHRESAVDDAAALAATVLSKLYPFATDAVIDKATIIAVVAATLDNFDAAAATHYRAFHAPKPLAVR